MNLAAIILGVFLVGLGTGGYLITRRESLTALIPTAFGVAFVPLGVAGGTSSMFGVVASALAVFGLAATANGFVKYLRGYRTAPVVCRALMAWSCLAYLVIVAIQHLS